MDMDPKGNVATTFGVDKRTVGPTMNELFSRGVDSSSLKLEDCTLGPDFLTRSMKASWRKSNPEKSRGPPNHIAVRNLWVLPADLDLSGIEVDLATRVGRENRLKLALSEAMESFDVIIIDTPASLGLLTVNALCAAEWVLIPIQAEFYALEGMGQLISAVRDVQKSVNPNLGLLGILMTMVQRSVSIAESPLEGAPIVIAQKPNKTNSASRSYWEFAKEADKRISTISED